MTAEQIHGIYRRLIDDRTEAPAEDNLDDAGR